MKNHLPAFALTVLSSVVNLLSWLFASTNLASRSGVFAMVSLGILTLLFVLRDFLPASRRWTRPELLKGLGGFIVLEGLAVLLDAALGHALNLGVSTGLALFCSMLALFSLNDVPLKARAV
jgi:hypothetical protein